MCVCVVYVCIFVVLVNFSVAWICEMCCVLFLCFHNKFLCVFVFVFFCVKH